MNAITVLVVEDEPLIGMDLQESLEERGLVVIGPCRTEAEAFARLAEARPSAAVLDVHLAGRTTRLLAEALAARGVPFVVITGHPREAVDAPFLSAPYMPKPFDGEALARLVLALAAGDEPATP